MTSRHAQGVCYDPEVDVDDWSVRVQFREATEDGSKPNGFRLAISRATHRGELTLAGHEAAQVARAKQPWWVRLLTRPPAGSPTTVHNELTGDTFDSLPDALAAAERLADGIEPDEDRVCVVVLDGDDRGVGGFWPGRGGSI